MNTISITELKHELEVRQSESAFSGNESRADAETATTVLPNLYLRNILVPFDFSDVTAALLRRLVPLAERTGATIHLLHVMEPTTALDNGQTSQPVFSSEISPEICEIMMRHWTKRIVDGRKPIKVIAQVGIIVDEIVSCATRVCADLIVMSTHVYKGLRHVLLRSITERVARNAPCPVLVLPDAVNFLFGPENAAFALSSCKNLLLPVDFLPEARLALAYAAAIAIKNGAKIHLLHTVQDDHAKECDSRRLKAEQRLAEWIRAELHWPVDFAGAVWVGIPAVYAILLEAKRSDIDLIILPTRCYPWAKRLRMMSVTDSILRHAPCPVLSIHESVNRFAD